MLEEEQLTKEIPFGYPNYLGSDSTAKDNRHRNTLVRKISKSAEASRISLEELKALIESQLLEWENPPNRPEADSHSFFHDMAMRYFQIFNEIPDKKKDGIFHQIVVEVLSILNLPSDDPSRKVDQAIDKFKNDKRV